MKKQLLSEELGRIKYLFNHERGVVISENNLAKSIWKGTIDFSNMNGNHAEGVDFKGGTWNLTTFSMQPNLEKKAKTGKEKIPPTLTELKLIKDSFPYPDNMIGPKFNNYPNSSILFGDFIEKLTDFISYGGIDNLNKIKIRGSADAARPNRRVPMGYTSLDHNLVGHTTPYNGETDRRLMNQYLADNRAVVLGQIIVNQILTSTGVDISSKMEYLPGINYYGQRDKRGADFRNVIVTPEFTPLLDRTNPDVQTITTTTTADTTTKVILSNYGFEDVEAIIDKNGVGVKTSENTELLNKLPVKIGVNLNGQSTYPGEINQNGELIVGKINFGVFEDSKSLTNVTVGSTLPDNTRYATKGSPVITNEIGEYSYIRILFFSLVP